MNRDNRDHNKEYFHREDILLETNFDEDGALTLAHRNVKQNGQYNAVNGGDHWQRGNIRKSFYRSDTSIDRFSEYSLHGRREQGISFFVLFAMMFSS